MLNSRIHHRRFSMSQTSGARRSRSTRDPANPDGYLLHLCTMAGIGLVTESDISESLQTFNSGCFKATAVMVGAAAESVVLEIRDTLVY